jgi:hypothetical protein
MATLATIQTFVLGNPGLQQRFQAARLQAAWNVLAEPGTTTNHANRLVWAKKVMNDYAADLSLEYNWYLSDANVQALGNSVSDAQMVSGVSALVDAWAPTGP